MILRKCWQSDFHIPEDLRSMALCWPSPPEAEEHDLHFLSWAAFLLAWTAAMVIFRGWECAVPEVWGNCVQPCHRNLHITETSMWNSKVIIHCMMWIISGQKYWTPSELWNSQRFLFIQNHSVLTDFCCQLKKLIILFYTPCRWFGAINTELQSHWK